MPELPSRCQNLSMPLFTILTLQVKNIIYVPFVTSFVEGPKLSPLFNHNFMYLSPSFLLFNNLKYTVHHILRFLKGKEKVLIVKRGPYLTKRMSLWAHLGKVPIWEHRGGVVVGRYGLLALAALGNFSLHLHYHGALPVEGLHTAQDFLPVICDGHLGVVLDQVC